MAILSQSSVQLSQLFGCSFRRCAICVALAVVGCWLSQSRNIITFVGSRWRWLKGHADAEKLRVTDKCLSCQLHRHTHGAGSCSHAHAAKTWISRRVCLRSRHVCVQCRGMYTWNQHSEPTWNPPIFAVHPELLHVRRTARGEAQHMNRLHWQPNGACRHDLICGCCAHGGRG